MSINNVRHAAEAPPRAGMEPLDIVQKLVAAVSANLQTEKGQKDFFTLGLGASGGTSNEATDFIKSEIVKRKPVIGAASIDM